MLTVEKLLAALEGLPPDAQVVVGIINGEGYDAAYAQQEVRGRAVPVDPADHNRRVLIGEAPALYICCYEDPRPWEGQQPTPGPGGTATLSYDPADDEEPPGGSGREG